MDIYCPKCGEPWDMDTIHEEVAERFDPTLWRLNGVYNQAAYDPLYQEVRKDFRRRGCVALGGSNCGPVADRRRAEAAAVVMDLLGDDLDGAAALLEDFEFLGMMDGE